MAQEGAYDLHAHLLGKLNRIGVDLAVLDRLFAFRLAVKADDRDLVGLARFFERTTGTERGGIIDGKDADHVRMRLQHVFGGLVALVLRTAAVEFAHDFDLLRRLDVVCIDHLLETLHAQDAGFHGLQIEHADFPAPTVQRLNHRRSRLLAAAKVVRGHLRHDFHTGLVAGHIDGEDRNARRVRFLNHRHDRF